MERPNKRRKTFYTDEELQQVLQHWDSLSDLSVSDSDDSYRPSDDNNVPRHFVVSGDDSEASSSDGTLQDEEIPTPEQVSLQPSTANRPTVWSVPKNSFAPRLNVTNDRATVILARLDQSSSEFDSFMQVFPRSLFIYTSQCTNQRLDILRKNKVGQKNTDKIKPTNDVDTDPYEIMMLVGIILVMCYNKLPSLSDYWSHHPSMGNETIKNAMSRNRFQVLISKLYFNNPEPPTSATKTYYADQLVSCLKYTFLKAREESPYQSIDESMTKFKGRSSLKQYLPMKPIKRGIKIWERCDSQTGYTYDFDIYSGKAASSVLPNDSTLGERVVMKLASSIRTPDVTLIFDRFFTSVRLENTIAYPAVGTCISNRKNMPKFSNRKLVKGQHEYLANDQQTLAARWQDSKEVVVLSNCHDTTVNQVIRKQKDGTKMTVSCPSMISFYNQHMGGVDLSDQKVAVYDFGRKSKKWWKKVFYKLLMVSVVNSWILHQEVTKKKTKLLQFLVPLAEQLIGSGKAQCRLKRKRTRGRPSSAARMMLNVGDHLPVEGTTRRRCFRCAQNKIETRTKTVCTMCKVPLCKNCFAPHHS